MSLESRRTRLLSVFFAVGIFASLPMPDYAVTRQGLLVTGLWIVTAGWAASTWYAPRWSTPLWWVGCVLSFLYGRGAHGFLWWGLYLCWGVWHLLRRLRLSRVSAARVLVLFLLTAQSISAKNSSPGKSSEGGEARSEKAPDKKVVPVPKYLAGYQLNDFSSCSRVDEIPWVFKAQRKVRLLLRDHLRLNTEVQFEDWEVNQVMDKDGYVTYVFSKVKDGQRVESLLVKDNVFNRIVKNKKKSRVTEVQDLRTLINRPVFIFHHQDGSTLSYSPGLAGQSVLAVELRQKEGRPLPPLYIRGSFCERAQGSSNSVDLLGKDVGTGTTTTTPTTSSGFSSSGGF